MPSIWTMSISPTGKRRSRLMMPSTLTLPALIILIASLAMFASPRDSRTITTRGRLFSRAWGPGLVLGAHVYSFRWIGQKPGEGSRFSCLGPNFLAISHSSRDFPLSASSPLRHLFESLRLVIRTFVTWIGNWDDTPADFSRAIPSTKILPFE